MSGRPVRKSAAQSLTELMVGLILLIPILLVIFDAAVVVIAVSLNDSVCRDAARAAAGGRPIDFVDGNGTTQTANARARALAVIQRANTSMKGYITGVTLVDADSGPTPPNPTGPDPNFGGQYYGTYTVVTEVGIKLPAAIPGLTPDTLAMKSKQTFPITFVEKNIVN